MEAKSDAVVNRGEPAPSLQVWDISQLRLRRANREDVLPIPARLEDLLPPEHLARQVWEVVSHLDLSAFYAEIAVVRTSAGRPALVGWEAQAQDGMRVRASAGAASFHREPTSARPAE